MPRLAPRPCTKPGCRALVDGSSRSSRCPEHAPPAWQTSAVRSAQDRGYGYQWQRIRRLVLAGEPLCRSCDRRGIVRSAAVVDHIVPKSEGGTDDTDNLQPLCLACHNEKTQAEARRGRER